MSWWQPLVYAALAGLVFAPLEWLWPERDEPRDIAAMRTDTWFASAGTLLSHVLLALVMGVVLSAAAQIEWFELPLHGVAATVVGLLIFELCGYAYHRAAHAIPLLWRLHAVHHSAPRMNWLASFRQHPVEIVLMTLAQNLPLSLLGVPLGGHALIVTALVLHTAFVHADLRIDPPWLRELIAMPRFHHRHHDRDAHPANFASLLPVLDRLFGSYADERAGRFGLDETHPGSFWALLAWPFRGARPVVVSGDHGQRRAAHLSAGHRSPAR